MKKILIILSCIFLCCSCSNSNNKEGLISYMEAKEMIINDNAILLDVRTEEEYNEDHIGGAILMPLDNINESTVSGIINDLNTEIIVYCRSGARSGEAKEKLEDLGYTHVYDLGAMSNWEE